MAYGDAQWQQQAQNANLTSLQGQVNGQKWYAPISFNPSSLNTKEFSDQGVSFPDQNGYLYLGSGYDPNSNPEDYLYQPFFYNPTGRNTISYGSASQNTVDQSGSYGGLVGQTRISQGGINGVQTPQGVRGSGPVVDNVTYSQPDTPQSQTAANPWTAYMFGNNGDKGIIQGTFGPGQNGPTTFFQNQPSSLNPAPQQGLGTLTPWNPAMQALIQSRSQP